MFHYLTSSDRRNCFGICWLECGLKSWCRVANLNSAFRSNQTNLLNEILQRWVRLHCLWCYDIPPYTKVNKLWWLRFSISNPTQVFILLFGLWVAQPLKCADNKRCWLKKPSRLICEVSQFYWEVNRHY